MKISTLLDHIDSGHIALPEFQRGYVWNRDQVRALFDSLYRRHPVGGLLVWATESNTAERRFMAWSGVGRQSFSTATPKPSVAFGSISKPKYSVLSNPLKCRTTLCGLT